MKELIYKLGGSVKDVDTQGRVVTGFFTNTGSLDFDGDIFAQGSFQKTIGESGPQGKNKIWHLWMHDTYSPINKPRVLEERAEGVYFETVFPDTELAKMVLALYQEGAISEHSVGFEVLKWEHEEDKRIIKESKMWEGSTVLWGANENTPFTGIKAEKIAATIGALEKICKSSDFTDETIQLMEIKIKQLEALKPVRPLEPPKEEVTDILFNKLF